MPPEDTRDRVEDLLYYLYLMAGRRFTGSFTVWLYDGRISRNTFQRLRAQLRRAGVPVDMEEAHAQVKA